MSLKQSTVAKKALEQGKPMAVRTVELLEPLQPLADLQDYWGVRVFVTWQGVPIGSVDIASDYQPVTDDQLAQAIAAAPDLMQNRDHLLCNRSFASASLPEHFSVSILVPTCNRPQDLRNCLQHLLKQQTARSIEIIVIDNRPDSGLTSAIVAEFPGVKLVNEFRPGSSYARNAGVAHSQGDIIVTIDDDATPHTQWLENLIAPFSRPEVMSVTGNILPIELETRAQQTFEVYGAGGLCRGFRCFEVNQAWLRQPTFAAPVWELGVTANAAFRASIFQHPEIGLWEEMLGAGVPAGGGEDIYFFYKILRAGFTHVYEPKACVWHRHRRDFDAFCRQVRDYSQGFIAHHLLTLVRHKDLRSVLTMATLPMYHCKQVMFGLSGVRVYPISMVVQEILGNVSGAWGLWRSRQHVRRYGRSRLPAPPSQTVDPPRLVLSNS